MREKNSAAASPNSAAQKDSFSKTMAAYTGPVPVPCGHSLATTRNHYLHTGKRRTAIIILDWYKTGLWIRIRIRSGFSDFVDPDPYWESVSGGKKIKKFQWKNALLVIF
jgi:hypothetical protein